MGPVYLCQDVMMGRAVALVMLQADGALTAPEQWERSRQRLQTEARAAGRVIHPNVVAALSLDSDEQDNRYLVLAHGSEPTLRDVLGGGALGVGRALDVAIDLARAVQALDSQGIVHRDIKPENILIAPDGTARLTGLGIAQLPEDILETREATEHPGTGAYMSPEQATSTAALDVRSDLYSLGLVLYEMLAGKGFGPGRFPAHQLPTETPAALIAIVERLLQPDPASRYGSAQAVVDDLGLVRGQSVAGQLRLALGRVSARGLSAVAAAAAVFALVFSIGALGRRLEPSAARDQVTPPTATHAVSSMDALLAFAGGQGRALALASTVAVAEPAAARSEFTDAYEPDEIVPAAISAWETQRRAFDQAGDIDRLVFLVKAGQGYLVTTANLATGVDTELQVLVDGGILANDDVSPGTLASQVAFTAGADGSAEVTVRNQDQYGPDRTYEVGLLLSAAVPAATAPPVFVTATPQSGQLFVPGATIAPVFGTTATPRATWTLRPTMTIGATRTLMATATLRATITRRPTWTRVPTWTPSPTLSGTRTPTRT